MDPYLTTAPGRIDLHVSGSRFATYNTAGSVPGFEALYAERLRAVTGRDPATGLGVWIGHGSVNGVNFGGGGPEESAGQFATVDLVARRGSQSVGFLQRCRWIAPDGAPLVNETRTIRVNRGPSAGALLDIDILLSPTEGREITLDRASFGLLAVQTASALLPDSGGQLRNSNDEFGAGEMNGRQAAWCACNGVVDGETVGLAILDHPDNPWHPSPWVCTEDGLLSPSPFPWRTYTLTREAPLTVKYRLAVHSGYVEAGWVWERLREWRVMR